MQRLREALDVDLLGKVARVTRIYVAGVNHFDPFHRALARTWLDQIAAEEDSVPAFVANEWSSEAYAFARDNRDGFMSCVLDDYKMMDAHSLRLVELSFGYEGDVFDDVFGHDRAFWLGGSTELSTLIDFRVKRCHQFVDYQGNPIDGPDFLRKLSLGAHACAQPPGPGDQRDGELAAAIHVKARKINAEWAIAIIGGNHAHRIDSTAVDLLDIDHDCRVRIMLANGAFKDL